MQNLDIGVLQKRKDIPARTFNISPIFSVKAQKHFRARSGQGVYFDTISPFMTVCELRSYLRCLQNGLNLPPSVSCTHGSEIRVFP